MDRRLPPLALLVSLFPAACGVPDITDLEPTVILVGLDGFRHDYAERVDTPSIDAITAGGVRAEALVPAFPSKSYPNLVSLSTGLRPVNHGIVSNGFWDPELQDRFSYGDPDDLSDPRWWLGEPIWATAERQGQGAAVMFWPGAQAPFEGVLPGEVIGPEHGMADDDRVDQVLAWLDRPVETRPTFLTLYLSDADDSGHWHGPDSPEIDEAVAHIDEVLGRLLRGLERRGIAEEVDILVVSDHGMADVDRSRTIPVDAHLDLDTVEVFDWTTVLTLWPGGYSEEAEEVDAVMAALADLEQATCHRREETPEAWGYRGSRRVAPVICEAEEGWALTTSTLLANDPDALTGGNHGYDPSLPSQQGVFFGRGPHLAAGVTVDAFETIEVTGIVAHALGLELPPVDGELSRVGAVLAD